jgi:arabinogalactan endo-1,4-beta-galactosidase
MRFLRVYGASLLLCLVLIVSGCQSTPPVAPTITPTLAPALPTSTPAPSLTVSRTSTPLLESWHFAVDRDKAGEQQGWSKPAYDDATWTTVSVPHTWNIMSEYADYSGLAWYRRTFTPTVEAKDSHLRLHFEAVFYLARVWLNGHYLGEHEGGYTPFEFDVSNLVKPGEKNIIVVEVDNQRAADRIPANPSSDWSYDWWNYGGLIREVSLETTGPTFIVRQQIVSVPHLTGMDEADVATITATVIVSNTSSQPLNSTLQINLLDDATGQAALSAPVSVPANVPAGETTNVQITTTLASPKLWHFDHPNLYRWSVSLLAANQQVLDTHEAVIGIRSIELKGGRFYLNGEPVRLVGVNRHADYPGLGSAETVAAMAADYNDLKALNEIFTRPVHYPQAEFILDYADRHGILLIPEVPAWQLNEQQLSSQHMRDLEKQQLGEMIAEDYNHPAIWAWSVGNEFASNSSAGHDFVKEMITHMKSLDPTRPVGFASDKLISQPAEDATALSDFVMMNEYFGTWHGDKQDLGSALDRIHQTWPDKTVIISEFGFAPHWNTKWGPPTASLDPEKRYFTPAYTPADSPAADAVRQDVINDQMPVFRSKPFVAGAIFWDYQDYRTPANYKTGLVDANRNKRGSWQVLHDQYSPAIIDAVTLSPVANNQITATVKLHTRGPVDVELPAYTLRGYQLHWAVTSPDGAAKFSEGDVPLPTLAPGAPWSGEIGLSIPQADYILTIDLMRPTGFSVTGWTSADQSRQPSAGLVINPIESLSPGFIMGADVSLLPQIEQSGGKFLVNGIAEDPLQILKDHGVNWIRLRLWNDPTDENGKGLGGGNNDITRTVEMAARAKALGFKVLLDFHYSDWWADPGKQNKPKAWENLSSEELKQAVYNYTANVIQQLAKADALPDMVQIGNEVNVGMIWPDGQLYPQGTEKVGGFDGFTDLLKQGIQAVRDTDPNKDNPEDKIKVMIHLANGGDNKLYRTMFDALTAREVDYDVIGLSYYNYWHGPFEDFKKNLNDISQRYNKDVVVAETAYAYTLADADGMANLFGKAEQKLGEYKATLQGQATAIRDVMAAAAQVPDDRGLGVFYWEPDWIPVPGAGWKTDEGNAWENQALFDFNGQALPSINMFNLVRPQAGRVSVPVTITAVYTTALKTAVGDAPKLPTTVKAAYSDDSIRDVPVTWNALDPAQFGTAGTFTITGNITGTTLPAMSSITVAGQKSQVSNLGFETGDLTGWTVEGDANAADVSSEATNIHDGKYTLHYWLADPFEFTVSQSITGLIKGDYALSAWIQGGGGEKTLQLFADCGGKPLTLDIKNTGWQQWQNPTLAVPVTDGACTIGLKAASGGASWAFVDDVEFAASK